jgi:putative transposase
VRCLLADREQLTSYLRFPVEHHRRIRHSNFIERTFGETRRRTKVIGRLPGETSCLSLVWAVLDRASRGWRGLTMTPKACDCCKTCAASSSTHLPRSDHPSTTIRATTRQSELSPNMHSTRKPRPSIYTAPGTPPLTDSSYQSFLHRHS